jgi:hypothetical protein
VTRRAEVAAIPLIVLLAVAAALPLASPPAVLAEHSGSALLPDLGMLAPGDFRIEKRPRGGRWLRFDTIVVNVGAGPLDVVGTNGGSTVTQRIRDSLASGGWADHATTATMFFDGDGHRHWHVLDFQEWTLTHATAQSSVLRSGAKSGFCFWDNYPYPGTATKVYLGSTECHERADGSIPMGLTVGWGDEYPSTIAGQYIDITGLGLGDYIVTVAADQRAEFAESDENNNRACARIRVSRSGVKILEQDTDLDGAPASCLP